MALIPVMVGISAVATMVGAGLSAYAAMRQGEAQKKMYDYQAAVAKINAEHAKQVGQQEALRLGMKTGFDIGQSRAIMGASNLDVNSGSAITVQKDRDRLGYWDEQTVQDNAAWKAFGNYAQANMATAAGMEAQTTGQIGAASSLISGVATAAGRYAQGQSIGLAPVLGPTTTA